MAVQRSSRFSVSRLSALTAALYCAACTGQDPLPAAGASASSSWLNVQDCGASGSQFETTAVTTAGSKEIVLKELGDFKVGQGVTVSRCNIGYQDASLRGPGEPYASYRPLKDAVEMRGYDGSTGGWFVFILEVDGADPATFRWSDDLARSWKQKGVAVTHDWQALSNGVEVKFKAQDWQPGHLITFSARDQLVSRIEKIEGTTLTLAGAANRAAPDAIVRHSDRAAIQAAIDRAIQMRRNLFFPAGYYRIPGGLQVRAEAIQIEGANATTTVLDIGDGNGSCFSLQGGTEVTIRNFRMVGHTGQAEAPGAFRLSTGKHSFWASALKGCNAVNITSTERVLVENVHASRMSSECFYCQAPSRTGQEEPKFYTKNLTFLRCSVTDCAANAFNNNDTSENTSILYCRVDGAGWQAYEGPGRFIKIIGNYVRNGGNGLWVGSMSHRSDHLHQLGCGQAIITDNVIEGIGRNQRGIWVAQGASQVVIANNLFINYNATAIEVAGETWQNAFPAEHVTVTGNIIDLTSADGKAAPRTGIRITASDTIVSGNQIYVRGACDPRVTGISVAEPAVNVSIHDNLIRACGCGLRTGRVQSTITEVIDATTFLQTRVPLEWKTSHLYRGWNLAWRSGSRANTVSVLDSFDPQSLRFKLREPHELKSGDNFEVFPPSANWSIHSNTITGCTQPMVLDSYGSSTSFCRDNLISRGEASGVKDAITIAGRFTLTGNHISGFDEPGSAALSIGPDAIGRVARNLCQRNTFERCTAVVREAGAGLWEKYVTEGNLFVDCKTVPASGGTVVTAEQLEPVLLPPPPKPVLRAVTLSTPLTVDGAVSEWPWQDASRVIALALTPGGDPIPTPLGYACAARDEANLYLAIRALLPKGIKAVGGEKWGGCDGVEVSFQNAQSKAAAPIYLVWGSADGKSQSGPYGGATPTQFQALEKALTYAAVSTAEGWTCELKIPFAAVGLDPLAVPELCLNIGLRQIAGDVWAAWVATGGALYQVGSAGKLVFEPKP